MAAGLFLAVPAMAARAEMTFTETQGGWGGSAFDIRCGAASYLSGITVFSGYWVDGITVHCGVIDAGNLPNLFFAREAAPYNAPDHVGGWQARGETLSCGPHYAVTGLNVEQVFEWDEPDSPYVGRIQLVCQRMMPPNDAAASIISASKVPDTNDYNQSGLWLAGCPANQWAVGVHGGSGIYVDHIGLICDSAFAAATPAPVAAPAPATVSAAAAYEDTLATGAFAKSSTAALLAEAAAAKPPVPEAPPVVVLPPSQKYQPPLAKSGLRLYACASLDNKVCERPVSDIFCKQQGFVQTGTYDTGKANGPVDVINGQKCIQKTCRVFDEIVCVR
jgi:hypothetical protein